MAVNTTESVSKRKNLKETETNRYPEWMGKERVRVYIESNGKDEPVVGCLNGYNFAIPTGEYVDIPVPIAEILQQSRRMIEESKRENKDFAEGNLKIG